MNISGIGKPHWIEIWLFLQFIEKGKYIKGITDGVENDYYATAWLKFALCHTDNVHDAYSLPSTGGGIQVFKLVYIKTSLV